MTDKPKTIGQLRRENEKLKARIAELEERVGQHIQVYQTNLYKYCDAETRIQQAVDILLGQDE